MGTFDSHEDFRAGLVSLLRRQLFGPNSEDPPEARSEVLSISPLQLYATGVLFPQKTVQELLEDDSEARTVEEQVVVDEELTATPAFDHSERSGDLDASSAEREPLNLANEFSPSAAGISFRLERPVPLKVKVSCGTYKPIKTFEPHPRAGALGADGQPFPETRDIQAYQRTHREEVVDVILDDKSGSRPAITLGIEGLKLHITVRPRADGTIVASAMLVNHLPAGTRRSPSSGDAFFQVALVVHHAEGHALFLPIDRSFGEVSDDPELASMDLLYRHRRAFALGHGTAGDWNQSEELSELGRTDWVSSVAVPTYDLKPIRPREVAFRQGADLKLSMSYLYDAGGVENPKQMILEALVRLAEDYEAWIVEQESIAASLPEALQAAAVSNLRACRKCHERMVRGIETLQKSDRAMLAFRLMNKAMLIQQHHSRLPPRGPDSTYPAVSDYGAQKSWRPFQLAFILMNVVSMSVPGDPERAIVDLIWFPTGGGKTEAYLGLAAFTICMERLRGTSPGTTVLMRYTLRLLTAQQFQRASALVLALETLRQDRDLNADLGRQEISIGLWVGQGLSPNSRDQARSALRRLTQEKYAPNPFQVLQCPWCGLAFTERTDLGYREIRKAEGERTVKLVCPDTSCRFGHPSGLPVYVIDEDIYEEPPTILIGTVDKFAQIAWDDRTGRLFGLGTSAPPPALVIQDELHLISGPLGTMIGLYETAIDRLCTRGGRFTHKIVASTATIRRAHEQCRALYARDSFEFPAQAVRAGESYFAFEDRKSAGRLYVGFMGNAVKSHQTALVRACSPLLQGVCHSIPAEDSKGLSVVDPYGTLVWYFNTLRELGHAATLCVGDIPEFLKGFCHRLRIPYDVRRYIREIVELTSRRKADEIPSILQQLDIPWRMKPAGKPPVDVLLATNMIAVGVDVSRLGLMVISGQPKGTSEYIQASSRIGRTHPGLVVTVYAQSKSRDRSHYERFVAYHQGLYRHVEPTSVTPFSPQARERGLRGVLIALARQLAAVERPNAITPHRVEIAAEVDAIMARAEQVDLAEVADIRSELESWLEFWRSYSPPEYGKMGGVVTEQTLAFPFGSVPHPDFQREAWPVPTSMRNVDGTSSARVLNVYDTDGEG